MFEMVSELLTNTLYSARARVCVCVCGVVLLAL